MKKLKNEAENNPGLFATLVVALVMGVGAVIGAGLLGIVGAGVAGAGTLGGAMHQRGIKFSDNLNSRNSKESSNRISNGHCQNSSGNNP